MLESHFDKVAGLQPFNIVKKRVTGVFQWHLRNFYRTPFSDRTLPVAAYDFNSLYETKYSRVEKVNFMEEIL